jgi:hypothetical protein
MVAFEIVVVVVCVASAVIAAVTFVRATTRAAGALLARHAWDEP